jgi:hypothetical protein
LPQPLKYKGKTQLLLIAAAFEIQGKAHLLLTEMLLYVFDVELYSEHKGEEFCDLNHFDKSAVPTFLVTLSYFSFLLS